MRALRFYLGFPPAIVKRRFGDTEYGIGAIPLGGFVKIPGMLRPEPGDLYDVDDLLDRSESLSEDEATAIGVALDDVRSEPHAGPVRRRPRGAARPARPPSSAPTRRCPTPSGAGSRARWTGSRRTSTRGAYWRCSRAPPADRHHRRAGRERARLLRHPVGRRDPRPPRRDGADHDVAAVIARSPADHAGLKPGDRLVGINGRVLPPLRVRNAIERSHGKPITVTVDRDGHRCRPRAGAHEGDRRRPTGSGSASRRGSRRTRSSRRRSRRRRSCGSSRRARVGARRTSSRRRGARSFTRPSGSSAYSADAADAGTPFYLTLLAFISLSLAIFNLLPFLPLDGGHVFMIALERMRGRMVSRAVFERISVLGIALMVLVFLIGLQNDLAGILSPSAGDAGARGVPGGGRPRPRGAAGRRVGRRLPPRIGRPGRVARGPLRRRRPGRLRRRRRRSGPWRSSSGALSVRDAAVPGRPGSRVRARDGSERGIAVRRAARSSST